MNAKECRDTRQEIDQSELHQALSDKSLRHVQSCAACRDFRDERARLRDLVASLEPVFAPADFDLRLRARLAAQRQGSRQSFFSRFAMSVPATAAAALVVMLVGSIVWMTQRNQSQSPAVASNTSAPANQANALPEDKSSVATNENTSPVAAGTITPAPNPDSTDIARNRNVSLNRRAARVALAKGSAGQSRDFAELPAQSIKGMDRAGEVSVTAPVKPMVVSMKDDRGTTRKISLPPVSFGSQRLVDNRIPVSATGNRVW